MSKAFDVTNEQLAHEFAMMKVTKAYNDGKIATYGEMFDLYINELDTMKTFLKSQSTK